MEISELEKAVKQAWGKETSSDPDNWSIENPAWGQCAVTSLVINDYLGGKLVWAEAVMPDGKKISHYFNNINNIEYDLTRCQFPEGTQIPIGADKAKSFATTRDYVISFPVTQKRYETLKKKVEDILK